MDIMTIVSAVLALLVGGALGYVLQSRATTKRIGDADELAKRIVEEARKEAQAQKKEILLQGQDDLYNQKRELENEFKERERDVKNRERKLEEMGDRLEERLGKATEKEHELLATEKDLARKERQLAENEEYLQGRIEEQEQRLAEIAGLTADEARERLLAEIEARTRHESARMIRQIETEARETADRKAKEILCSVIQRYAGDYVNEQTVTAVSLPSEDMKGRIIGREGRNIRALEAATGVSILIDDTPEAVVISCFDPVRKEVARQLMERLIGDGRIHPTRVEELAKKISKELEEELYQVGEAAVLETGIQGVPPQLVKLLGRLKYRYSFSQNVLQHSLETSYFMGMIAAELGLDEQKAKRIGLFHDLGKAIDHEVEGPHAQIGADLLRKHNEAKDVIHAVAAHHGEVEPESLYDILIAACDTLSASRPGARSETTELYLKRLEQLEAIARDFPGVESCFALQAGREIRVVVMPEKVSEGEAQMLAKEICGRIEKEMTYPGQIKVTIIRETRSVEYAK